MGDVEGLGGGGETSRPRSRFESPQRIQGQKLFRAVSHDHSTSSILSIVKQLIFVDGIRMGL
jgi:hypothetical protein